jgi:hypothetical protein
MVVPPRTVGAGVKRDQGFTFNLRDFGDSGAGEIRLSCYIQGNETSNKQCNEDNYEPFHDISSNEQALITRT